MKNTTYKILAIGFLLLAIGYAALAQTNAMPPMPTDAQIAAAVAAGIAQQQASDAANSGIGSDIGNIAYHLVKGGTAAVFYGQKLTDAKVHCWGAIYGYAVIQTTNSGDAYIVLGIDHLWASGGNTAPANFTLSGGVNLDTGSYYPAQWLGVTNSWLNKIAVKGFATALVGSETGGGAQVMNLERGGGYISIHDWNIGNFTIEPDIGLAYGNRTGVNSTYDGNWWNAFFAISIHGKKA